MSRLRDAEHSRQRKRKPLTMEIVNRAIEMACKDGLLDFDEEQYRMRDGRLPLWLRPTPLERAAAKAFGLE